MKKTITCYICGKPFLVDSKAVGGACCISKSPVIGTPERGVAVPNNRRKSPPSMAFVREWCGDFDRAHDRCLWDRPCLVALGKRCRFFEEVVLPLADQYPEWAESRHYYRAYHGLESVVVRKCGCGAALPARKRFCDACRQTRRRQGRRESYDRVRNRSKTGQLTENGPSQVPVAQ